MAEGPDERRRGRIARPGPTQQRPASWSATSRRSRRSTHGRPAARSASDGDVQLSASGLPARVVNAANLARFAADEDATRRIEDVRAFFGRFGVPFRWFVGPTSAPADLDSRLAAAGHRARLSDTPGMALDIATMNDEPTTVRGLEVREVADTADFEAWLQRLRRIVPVRPRSSSTPGVQSTSRSGSATTAPSTTTLAGSTGRPVAVSAILYGRETAGIWNVGALADVRGRGIGRETTLTAAARRA